MVSQAYVRMYRSFRCHVFAIALHRLTGLPIGAVFDIGDWHGLYEAAQLRHAFVVTRTAILWGETEAIDITGLHTVEEIMADYVLVAPRLAEFADEAAFRNALPASPWDDWEDELPLAVRVAAELLSECEWSPNPA